MYNVIRGCRTRDKDPSVSVMVEDSVIEPYLKGEESINWAMIEIRKQKEVLNWVKNKANKMKRKRKSLPATASGTTAPSAAATPPPPSAATTATATAAPSATTTP